MPEPGLVERVWWGGGAGATAARLALRPAAALFGVAVRARNALYDAGALASRRLAVPAISVGNLSVGGTGKTPVAAWIATMLRDRGARPAILLRGYGGDEPAVHARLNPGLPVIVGADRVESARRAHEAGADLVVLDDAFQHRRARRDVDLVLVSAERWTGSTPLLPAGPWREPLASLARASMVLITRKAVRPDRAAEVADQIAARVADVTVGVIALTPAELRTLDGDAVRPLPALRDASVLAIAAIGDPASFVAQLEALGAQVEAATFADHHAFSEADVATLASRAASADFTVCTLKDAVKLGPRWPRQARPLWYVSQRVALERGDEALDLLIGSVIRTRAAPRATADSSRPLDRSHGH